MLYFPSELDRVICQSEDFHDLIVFLMIVCERIARRFLII